MYQNDLPMSLKSDTFNALCSDFDDVLRSTLRGMVETDQDTAEINVKVKISLTESSAPDFSVAGGQQTREITKPKFDHTVSAVIQRKEKKTGTLAGEYELVFDSESGRYVMRPIDNGQMTLFDKKNGSGGEVIDVEYHEVPGLPEGQRALPGDPQESDSDEEGNHTAADEGNEPEHARESGGENDNTNTPFGWLKQFVGEKLRVTEAMGNYTVRTMENRVVLSSATSETSPFYCPAEKLEPHVGHNVVCVGYGQDEIVNISIECEDCSQVLYDLDAPAEDEGEGKPLTDEEIAVGLDMAADAIRDEEDADGEGYGYEDPETDGEEAE